MKINTYKVSSNDRSENGQFVAVFLLPSQCIHPIRPDLHPWPGIRLNIPDSNSFNSHAETLLSDGFCLLPGVLSAPECRDFIAQYDRDQVYRSTVDMARYNFGRGQ